MRPRLATVLLALGLAPALACGDHAPEPQLPEVDFTPVLEIAVDDDGLSVQPGERELDGVSLEPPTVPTGSVVEVRNESSTDRRVVGDDAELFDTGTLRPGDSTVVVLTEPGTHVVAERERPDGAVSVEVVADQEMSTK